MELRDDQDTPVLFAGGGLVGLSTAMFLAQHGIPSLAVERLHRGSHLPRAAHFHMRTLELFRSAGIEFDGRGVFSNSVTIYFTAPLTPLLVGKNFSVIYVKNEHLSGFFRLDKDQQSGFLAINTVGDTSRSEASNPADDVREETLVAHLRR